MVKLVGVPGVGVECKSMPVLTDCKKKRVTDKEWSCESSSEFLSSA